MRTKIIHRFLLALIVAVSFNLWSAVHLSRRSQARTNDFEGELVYVREVSGAEEFVRLSTGHRYAYALSQGECGSVSPGGVHVAKSSPAPDDLVILDLVTQTIVIQESWHPDWELCSLHWLSDTQLRIQSAITPSEIFYYDISIGMLTPYEYQPIPSPPYPPLPDAIPTIRQNFILPSPAPGVYLYQRCPGQITVGDGEDISCAVDTEFAIYDTKQQATLHVLDRPDSELIEGFDYLGIPVGYPNGTWSAGGRYLAYQYLLENYFNKWNLRVYDLASDRYLEMQFWNAEIDSGRAIQWSPQGNRLAFWIVGRVGEPVAGDDHETLRHLIFYDADQESFESTAQPFDLEPVIIDQTGSWSPDGLDFAFVALDRTLIAVDAVTGQTNQLDSDVLEIVSWVPVDSALRITDGLLALYTFEEGSGSVVHDVSGVGTPLDLTIGNPAAVSWGTDTLTVTSPTLIASPGAATKVISALQASQEITLEAWVAPASATQDGPARIVTLSQDPYHTDMTLGQGHEYTQPANFMVARLRTTTTDLIGRPALWSYPGTLMPSLSQVVYTRDAAGNTRLYVNGVERMAGVAGGDFTNWGTGYRLALANELTENRAWLGDYYLVAIYDRALTPGEIQQNLTAGPAVSLPPTARVTADLQALYTFEEGSGSVVHDVSGVGTPLDLTIDDVGDVTWDEGVLSVTAPTLIASPGAATKINSACQASSEITLEAWLTPVNRIQDGPARIMTLSDGAYTNAMLGQGAYQAPPSNFSRPQSSGGNRNDNL